MGIRRAAAAEAAHRCRSPRRVGDRGDGSWRPRGGVPRQARAPPVPGVDGEADPRPVRPPGRALRRSRRRDAGRASRPAPSCSNACRRCRDSARTSRASSSGLLGKRLDVRPPGWELVAADWPSIADVDTFERVGEIREKKRAAKAGKLAARPRLRLHERLRQSRLGGLDRPHRRRAVRAVRGEQVGLGRPVARERLERRCGGRCRRWRTPHRH